MSDKFRNNSQENKLKLKLSKKHFSPVLTDNIEIEPKYLSKNSSYHSVNNETTHLLNNQKDLTHAQYNYNSFQSSHEAYYTAKASSTSHDIPQSSSPLNNGSDSILNLTYSEYLENKDDIRKKTSTIINTEKNNTISKFQDLNMVNAKIMDLNDEINDIWVYMQKNKDPFIQDIVGQVRKNINSNKFKQDYKGFYQQYKKSMDFESEVNANERYKNEQNSNSNLKPSSENKKPPKHTIKTIDYDRNINFNNDVKKAHDNVENRKTETPKKSSLPTSESRYDLASKPRDDENFQFEIDKYTFYSPQQFWIEVFKDLDYASYKDFLRKILQEGYYLGHNYSTENFIEFIIKFERFTEQDRFCISKEKFFRIVENSFQNNFPLLIDDYNNYLENLEKVEAENDIQEKNHNSYHFKYIYDFLRYYNKHSIKDIFDYLAELNGNVDDIYLQDFSRGLKNTGFNLNNKIEYEKFEYVLENSLKLKHLTFAELLDLKNESSLMDLLKDYEMKMKNYNKIEKDKVNKRYESNEEFKKSESNTVRKSLQSMISKTQNNSKQRNNKFINKYNK